LDRFGLEIGDQASLRVFGTALPVDIVDSVAAVPGTRAADAMTADLTALTATMLAAGVSVPAVNHVWIDATPEALAEGSAATGVAEVAGEHAQVLDRSSLEEELRGDVITRLSLVTFWVTSGASALLAVAGLVAAAALLIRQRSSDVALLRSVGASPGQQASARWREQAVIAVFAVGLGSGVGWLVTTVTAGLLAKAATPSAPENLQPVLRLAAGPWAGYLVTLLLLCLLVAVVHGACVRQQGSRPPARDGVG
jgi:predicted lysophospholipase L1 biosynthesis ABC-type transport system permease subunit